MKTFIETEKYGILNFDKIFFESYFPIIFTCKNQANQLFLVVCCMNNKDGCKWLIGKTYSETIVDLLKDKITLREILLNAQDRMVVNYKNKSYSFDYSDNDFKENSIYLPKKDSFMYVDDDEFEEEIEYYSDNKTIIYGGLSYNKLLDANAVIRKEMINALEILPSFELFTENLTMHREIKNTLVELKNLYIKMPFSIKVTYESPNEYQPVFESRITVSNTESWLVFSDDIVSNVA